MILVLLACADPPSSGPPPDGSIYAAPLVLESQSGAPIELGVHRGHPTFVAMIYTSCTIVCPMLVTQLQAAEAELTVDERDDARFLLLSLDPERDTPTALTDLARSHGLPSATWALARPQSVTDVRTIAALLDIRFRPMPNGAIDHSAAVTLLDREGRIVARVDGTNAPLTPLLTALRTGALNP